MYRSHYSACLSLIILSVFCRILVLTEETKRKPDVLVFTVATKPTDGFQRFIRSTKRYDLPVEVLGMGEEWKGGDVARYAGGGHKVNLLKDALQKYKDDSELIVMFVDSYDLMFTSGADKILPQFKKFESRVVFSTEGFCWPDPSLAEQYPVLKPKEKRFLNSGGFMGYASDLYGLVTSSEVADKDDDQLFYTRVFLNLNLRKKFSMSLDTKGEIFQNLNGALHEVELKFKGASSYLYNSHTGNTPIVIHGNGPIKDDFNNLANYLADQWTQSEGCQVCNEDTISLEGVKEEDYPTLLLAIFIEHPTAFITEFFKNVVNLNYPKNKISVFLHYADEFHRKDVTAFKNEHESSYQSLQLYSPVSNQNEWSARNKAVDMCIKQDCQYLFSIDGDVHVDNKDTIKLLIERNRSVIAPLVVRPAKMWSNFWGAVNHDGFYKRSADYQDILQYKKMGLWNVPYISGVYLVHGHRLPELKGAYINGNQDPDMAMCKTLREKGIFMYLENLDYYGHLINSDNYETTHLHNDLYQIFDNSYAWDKKYIHREYYDVLSDNYTMEKVFEEFQPCPDVFWVPIVTPVFCQHLIEEMEHLNQWSNGKNEDSRLAGGYENVPTVDTHANQIGWDKHWLRFLSEYVSRVTEKVYAGYIPEDPRLAGGYENVPTVDTHTNQIGWEAHWLYFLKSYVAPINSKLYQGYFSESRAIMNFVVRYRPDEQDRLRPHADSSTFTINVALNDVDKDYQGGGVRFLRYNCTVLKTRKGWLLMHPGRLTHHHEGLPTTKGTRYIMISFIDP